MENDDRPKWSITWLLRIQRVGRSRQPDTAPDQGARFYKWFPWAVLLTLLVEIGVLVWLGLIPR